jgi:hypothetical protein
MLALITLDIVMYSYREIVPVVLSAPFGISR